MCSGMFWRARFLFPWQASPATADAVDVAAAAAASSGYAVVVPRIPFKHPDDGIAMNVGYGSNGVSAQTNGALAGYAGERKPDRVIMLRTIMRGKVSVTSKEICDGMRHKGKLRYPNKAWEEVMRAGFAQFPVGRLIDAGTRTSRVLLSQWPGSSSTPEEKARRCADDWSAGSHVVSFCSWSDPSNGQRFLNLFRLLGM
jgi:hypothetical protein